MSAKKPRKTSKKSSKKEVTTMDFNKFLKREMKRSGKTAGQIIEETFGDGFVRYVEEAGKGEARLSAWGGTTVETEPAKRIADYRKLRKEFAPVSQCVDYIKSIIIGSHIAVQISDPKDKFQKELKEHLEFFSRIIRQDVYTRSLFTLMGIMVDESLTTGSVGAEIVYEKNPTFDPTELNPREVEIKPKGKKKTKMLVIDVKDPQWNDVVEDDKVTEEGLGGIVRLKIFQNAVLRLKRYRDPLSWEIMYWTLDETGPPTLHEEVRGKQKKPEFIKFHPWQIFWLPLNRRDWDVNGESVISPVYTIAKILERIMSSVSEGIYRAGNKKFFIVTGTEKRPWSSPHIRDVMSQFKEMGEKDWTAVPVPAGFELKEIGGEVFEAQNIINVLLTLIAQGMNCPKEILGLSSRGSGERQLLTSHIEIAKMKNTFMSAIEDQLFARQVWCKHGKTRTKQSGRSFEPIYIPTVKIGTQGLMSPIARLEVCLKLLNVANPLDPRGKLRTEQEIYDIMGWDEIILESQEELDKRMKELEKWEMKQMKKGEEPKKLPKLGKEQGKPDPQTLERQKKRLQGMAKKGQTEKGKSKPMGSTRKPK